MGVKSTCSFVLQEGYDDNEEGGLSGSVIMFILVIMTEDQQLNHQERYSVLIHESPVVGEALSHGHPQESLHTSSI